VGAGSLCGQFVPQGIEGGYIGSVIHGGAINAFSRGRCWFTVGSLLDKALEVDTLVS
jgi:hypothetical protein